MTILLTRDEDAPVQLLAQPAPAIVDPRDQLRPLFLSCPVCGLKGCDKHGPGAVEEPEPLEGLDLRAIETRLRSFTARHQEYQRKANDFLFEAGRVLLHAKDLPELKGRHGEWAQRVTGLGKTQIAVYLLAGRHYHRRHELAGLSVSATERALKETILATAPKREPRPLALRTAQLPEDLDVRLIDARRLPEEWADEVDVWVTSPPYCLATEDRGYVDYVDYDVYLVDMARALDEMLRCGSGRARLALNVPFDIRLGGTPRPIGPDLLRLARDLGWQYQATIAWSRHQEGQITRATARGSMGSPNAPVFLQGDEALYLLSKGPWDLGRPGDPGDFTIAEQLQWSNGRWVLANQLASLRYPHTFSPLLAERLIRALSFPGAVIGDSFLGSGTTAAVAARFGRRFRGGDLNPTAVAIAQESVAAALESAGAEGDD